MTRNLWKTLTTRLGGKFGRLYPALLLLLAGSVWAQDTPRGTPMRRG